MIRKCLFSLQRDGKGKGLGHKRGPQNQTGPRAQNNTCTKKEGSCQRPLDGRGQGSGPGLRRGPQDQTGPRAQDGTCIKKNENK